MLSRSLGTYKSQLSTAATKISIFLLFIPLSPAEPTQHQERSWSLFLALQGREQESLRCCRAELGLPRPIPSWSPGAWSVLSVASRQEGLHPNRDKALLFSQRGVGETVGGREAPAPPSASLQDLASLKKRLQCRWLWKESLLLLSCFFCLGMGKVGGPKSQPLLPPGLGVLRGVEESELRVTPRPMLCQGQTCFAQP